jgi:drug/metabolite transporter (DMT)-like permease
VAEAVEQGDLLLGVAADRMGCVEAEHELAHPRAQLVGEVGRRRPDEGVDVGEGRLGHKGNPNEPTAQPAPERYVHLVRRVSAVDAMLLGTVLLWALNITVTKYVLTHGWSPLAYGTIRYFAAISLFWAFTYHRERSFRIERSDLGLVLLAAGMIFLNQLCFVYGLKLSHASTVALLLGTTPVFVGLISLVLRLEHLSRAFWVGAAITFAGVALIAASAGGFSSGLKGDLLAIGTALTWACYTVTIAPLMRRYSPFRISALVLAIGWVPLALVSIPQLASQEFSFGWKTWLGFGYAVIGPLFLTNILWFTAIDRVGPSRASLFGNLQPFLAVFFAVVLLSETLHSLEIAGGVLIFAGILLERLWHQAGAPSPPVE